MKWPQLTSIRIRVALGAAATGLIVLGIGAFAFIGIAKAQMISSAQQDVSLAADQIVVALSTGSMPEGLRLAARADGTQIRVLDEAGQILALSPALTQFERNEDGTFQRIGIEVDPSAFPAGPGVIAATATATDRLGRILTVEASRPPEAIDEATRAMARTALMVAPLAIAAIAIGAYRTSARSLAPVLDITRHAASIDDQHRDGRVPVPNGRDEITELSETLNDMLERFERARNREESLVSDVAHELRTPLTAIRTRLETMAREPVENGTRSSVEEGLRQVRRLEHLVAGLLDLSRLEAPAAISPESRAVAMDELVTEVIRERADGRISLVGEPANVEGDPTQLARVLTNLLDNALRQANREVLVTLVGDDARVLLSVDDDGPGIPEGERARIFERFVQLDEARSRPDAGTGLGLPIVRAIVRRHGGEIAVLTSPLGGARFEVWLPAS